jgi:nucleoside 2-deoxyribosyltransferase
MKYYIASSFQNRETVRRVAGLLNEEGWIQTYDWTKNEKAADAESLRKIGEKEREAVRKADLLILILILPGGKGSHIEMGMALGIGKPVYIYCANENEYSMEQPTTFYQVGGVELFCGTIKGMLNENK